MLFLSTLEKAQWTEFGRDIAKRGLASADFRGDRNDYHMLRTQWHGLFEQTLAPEFPCLCDSPCYADEYLSLFTIHYGRG